MAKFTQRGFKIYGRITENKRKDEVIAEMRENDLREYEFWTGARWQTISPYTIMLRKRALLQSEKGGE